MLIGHMFQDKPRNKLEALWWWIKLKFGWKNTTGIPIISSNQITKDSVVLISNIGDKDGKRI